MKINYNDAIMKNTIKKMPKMAFNRELVQEVYTSFLQLLITNVNFDCIPEDYTIDIMEAWLPWSSDVYYDSNNDILTVTNPITGHIFKYAVDFSKGILCYLPTSADSTDANAVAELKAEYDGYDASQETIEACTGEEAFV